MEAAQAVDVSWLHHSNKAESQVQKKLPSFASDNTYSNGPQNDVPPAVPVKNPPKEAPPSISLAGVSNGAGGSHGIHRPHLHLHHGAESKEPTGAASPTKPTKDRPSAPALSRKGSWLSSIKSQFSSSNQQIPSPAPSPAAKPASTIVTSEQANGAPATPTPQKDVKKGEQTVQTPSSPKGNTPSFLQSALRRLSSSGGGMGKMSGTGGVCPRKVMNIDPYRERCQIEELQSAKLRRVSFCVDVEIAGHSTPLDDDEEEQDPPTPGRRPSLAELEKHANNKKNKQQNAKMKEKAEGEALKHPEAVTETKEASKDVKTTEAEVVQSADPATSTHEPGEQPQISRKKEKKKKSEEERKARKEKKRLQAVANGSIPLEITKERSSSESPSPGAASPAPPRDRPTTDPLRIYKRCCQLRETSPLKRLTEQLSSPSACEPSSYGTVLCLDFTGSRMHLPDIVTLGDYLGVVPVKKLVLEDCDLTDEAVRIVLAGLLAVKTPEQAKFNRELTRDSSEKLIERTERLGVIEKISLKNNPKIGRDGWQHIALFMHMSRSLKAIDLSMNKFPIKSATGTSSNHQSHTPQQAKPQPPNKTPADPGITFEKCLIERPVGNRLEELVMADCGLNTDLVKKFVRGVKESGISRLGLASNNLEAEGLEAIADFVRTGQCEGLDLGGNALTEDLLRILVQAIEGQDNRLYALSLADCSLTPQGLRPLLPALAQLSNFRFIDLSHNRRLFSTQPNALGLFRKYLPRMGLLKRIHLNDVAMEPEHCIALAEILPEIPSLGHISILENPQMSALASSKDETSREEACALYASLMAAVRVSSSIIAIDVDVPTADAGEVVQALAKQVVAYSLRNMERGPIAEIAADESKSGDKAVEVPEVLLHIVGHSDVPGDVDDDGPAPDNDYIVGGTGVVKALSVCLGNKIASDFRRPSGHTTPSLSGTATPRHDIKDADVKSKAMSKNLLGSARKIRARLQPAIAREETAGDDMAYRKLKFLDSTLERIIQRFEDEYPECRLRKSKTAGPDSLTTDSSLLSASPPEPADQDLSASNPSFKNPLSTSDEAFDAAEGDDTVPIRPSSRGHLSRADSEVSLHSRHLADEEGRMLRFGQQIRRDILRPEQEDHHHGTTGEEIDPEYIQSLRRKMEAIPGSEIRDRIETIGYQAAVKELEGKAERLRAWKEEDPEAFEEFRRAQRHAEQSVGLGKEGRKGNYAADANEKP